MIQKLLLCKRADLFEDLMSYSTTEYSYKYEGPNIQARVLILLEIVRYREFVWWIADGKVNFVVTITLIVITC